MNIPHLLLLVFALVFEIIGATTLVGGDNRVRIIAAGLAFFVASFISW